MSRDFIGYVGTSPDAKLNSFNGSPVKSDKHLSLCQDTSALHNYTTCFSINARRFAVNTAYIRVRRREQIHVSIASRAHFMANTRASSKRSLHRPAVELPRLFVRDTHHQSERRRRNGFRMRVGGKRQLRDAAPGVESRAPES